MHLLTACAQHIIGRPLPGRRLRNGRLQKRQRWTRRLRKRSLPARPGGRQLCVAPRRLRHALGARLPAAASRHRALQTGLHRTWRDSSWALDSITCVKARAGQPRAWQPRARPAAATFRRRRPRAESNQGGDARSARHNAGQARATPVSLPLKCCHSHAGEQLAQRARHHTRTLAGM